MGFFISVTTLEWLMCIFTCRMFQKRPFQIQGGFIEHSKNDTEFKDSHSTQGSFRKPGGWCRPSSEGILVSIMFLGYR